MKLRALAVVAAFLLFYVGTITAQQVPSAAACGSGSSPISGGVCPADIRGRFGAEECLVFAFRPNGTLDSFSITVTAEKPPEIALFDDKGAQLSEAKADAENTTVTLTVPNLITSDYFLNVRAPGAGVASIVSVVTSCSTSSCEFNGGGNLCESQRKLRLGEMGCTAIRVPVREGDFFEVGVGSPGIPLRLKFRNISDQTLAENLNVERSSTAKLQYEIPPGIRELDVVVSAPSSEFANREFTLAAVCEDCAAPFIIGTTPSQKITLTQSLDLKVDAIGIEPLEYTWYADGVPIADTQTVRVSPSRTTSYVAEVRSECGIARSDPINVAVALGLKARRRTVRK